MPTANPDNPACQLLTKKDRSDLVGYSMDAEVPVRPVRGSVECVWVYSLREPARSAIRVMALSGEVWARTLRAQIRSILLLPSSDQALRKRLESLMTELGESGGKLAADEVCPTYLMLAEARGALRDTDSLFYASIGSMTAAYAMSCEDGNMILAGYGEYGIGPSIALNRGVIKLLDSAKERSGDFFQEVEFGVEGEVEGKTEGPDSTDPNADDAGRTGDEVTDEPAAPGTEPTSDTDGPDIDGEDAS